MAEQEKPFKLMGLDPSPYTWKVQSYLEFKDLPYEWMSRTMKAEPLFQKHAKVQLIPLLFFPTGETMQDSTLIIERLEEQYPDRTVYPEDKALWFLSALLEEFGDEWCNKLMFFQRWSYEQDARATGKRLANERLQGQWWALLAKPIAARLMVKRMVPRLSYSGGSEVNIPQLKESFESLSALLNEHFRERSYVFGGRPCFGDFGLWCNLYQAWTDPTAHAYLEEHAPFLVGYIKRMREPSVEGEFETLETLKPTLQPILTEEVARRFLPWMEANRKAFEAGQPETSLHMRGKLFKQKTFKYQAKTLEELTRKCSTVSDDPALRSILEETGCLPFFDQAEG